MLTSSNSLCNSHTRLIHFQPLFLIIFIHLGISTRVLGQSPSTTPEPTLHAFQEARKALLDANSLASKEEQVDFPQMDSYLQEIPGDPCGHHSYNPETFDSEKQQRFETEMQKLVAVQREKNQARNQAVLQIPVVVHVIHQGDPVGTGENISQAQIQSQIQALNDAFSRKEGTRYASADNHAGLDYGKISRNAEIEFVLATIDPDGNPTNGINRVEALKNYHLSPDFVDEIIKPATIWNPNYYMNFWSARLTDGYRPGLLGYAVFPTMSTLEGLFSSNTANTDGIVCDYRTVGSNDYAENYDLHSSYQYGVTAIHEVGHFLGLRHIWGDGLTENEGCTVDDYVDDTPNAAFQSDGCEMSESCGSIDLNQNYMDYGTDACKNVFTNGQILRMQTVLSNSPRRASLTTSPILQGQPIPDGSKPTNDLCTQAIAISCGDDLTASTLGATVNGAFTGMDGRICSGEAATQGVWYKLVGQGEEVSINTALAGTRYDATVHVFRGPCDDLICVGGNDDGSSVALNTGSELIFLAVTGETYFIYISGKEGDWGQFRMQLECIPFNQGNAPANDIYTQAIPLSCGMSMEGTTDQASLDAIVSGECCHNNVNQLRWCYRCVQ